MPAALLIADSAQENDCPAVYGRRQTVLIVAIDPGRRDELARMVEGAGWFPLHATTAGEALEVLYDAPPDLLLLDVAENIGAELEVLDCYRTDPDGDRVPVVCLLARPNRKLTVDAFLRRADDVVSAREHPDELQARLRARLERPPLPRTKLLEDPVTGALTSDAFAGQMHHELQRISRGGRSGVLALLALDELPAFEAQFGSRARDEVVAQVVRLIKKDGRTIDFVGLSRGLLGLLLPNTPRKGAQIRLERLSRLIYDQEFAFAGTPLRLVPIIGHTELVPDLEPDELEDRAWAAVAHEAGQLDLNPTRWVKAMSTSPGSLSGMRRSLERIRTPLQVGFQQLVLFGLPFAVYTILDRFGIDITGAVYLVLVAAIALTSVAILAESRAALRRPVPPPAPDGPMPRATAIIAAYLPNEADTIVETVEVFLGHDYPDLQVILAYNTPRPLPVEEELREIATRDPRFEPLRVEGSVSKAQNVNAALNHVRGEFVGLFDADHHPEPGSYKRAWQWIASGVGIVQGHCLVRNGSTNFVTRLVATEFEAIYAVSHPGRARLHGFGIFGGSNGYWRTSLLRRTRMRGFMLTEDIDSSMRVVKSGETIVSDPNLVSTELAPETVGALWNQRLRWAQGWSQVSRRHLASMVRTMPTARGRLGLTYLLGWREVYPWLTMQMVPLLTFWWVRGRPPMNWFIPFFAITSLFTLSAGPIQGWFAWKLAHPSIRQHGRWFVLFVLSSVVFYTEFKNAIARTAHIKEAMRERKWKVTPRSPQQAREPLFESEALLAASEPEMAPLATTDDGWLGLSMAGVNLDETVDAGLVSVG